jgi:membrane-bound lytic murein transglycosylase B
MKITAIRSLLLLTLVFSVTACSSVRMRGQSAGVAADSSRASLEHLDPQSVNSKWRGWDYVVEKLRDDGISEKLLAAVYRDSRMPLKERIPFKLAPVESRAIYKQFTEKSQIELARTFMSNYRDTLAAAARRFKVSPAVVSAILMIESRFGEVTGEHLVAYRLSRVASAPEDRNVQWNYERLSKETPNISLRALKKRAEYLDKTFYPEIRTLLQMAERDGLDVFQLKGSISGAFGLPQFLPTSFEKYAVDGDGDGEISVFKLEDAIFSVANYFAESGWRDGLSQSRKHDVVMKYNKSKAYAEAVLKIAGELEAEAKKIVAEKGRRQSW